MAVRIPYVKRNVSDALLSRPELIDVECSGLFGVVRTNGAERHPVAGWCALRNRFPQTGGRTARLLHRSNSPGSANELWTEERTRLLALPATPFTVSRMKPVEVSSQSLVKVEGSWYSVPSRVSGDPATSSYSRMEFG